MEQEIIVFYGLDMGSFDRTVYGMFDGSTFKEISENEYREFTEKLQQQKRADFSFDRIGAS